MISTLNEWLISISQNMISTCNLYFIYRQNMNESSYLHQYLCDDLRRYEYCLECWENLSLCLECLVIIGFGGTYDLLQIWNLFYKWLFPWVSCHQRKSALFCDFGGWWPKSFWPQNRAERVTISHVESWPLWHIIRKIYSKDFQRKFTIKSNQFHLLPLFWWVPCQLGWTSQES